MNINETNYKEFMNTEKPVMLDLSAEWCGPCKSIAPIVHEIETEYKDKVAVGNVDIENCPNIAQKYRIKNIPTVLFIKNGELKDKTVGLVTKEVLCEKLNSLC